MTKDEIRTAALRLDPRDRESLAEELLLSVSEQERDAIDAAWLSEARRRDAAFQSGQSSSRPVNEVIQRLQSRASK